jgi:hypothetical protein
MVLTMGSTPPASGNNVAPLALNDFAALCLLDETLLPPQTQITNSTIPTQTSTALPQTVVGAGAAVPLYHCPVHVSALLAKSIN